MAKNLSQAQDAFKRMAGVKSINADQFTKTVANQNNMTFTKGDIINFPADLTDRIFEQELKLRGQESVTVQFILCEVEHENGGKEAMQIFPSMFSRVASVVDENGISTGRVEPTKGTATEDILNNFGGANFMEVVKYIVANHGGKVKVSDATKYRVMGFNDRLRNMNIYTFDWV
jgi:hypothetical protein